MFTLKQKKEKIVSQILGNERENAHLSFKKSITDEEKNAVEDEMQIKINNFLQSKNNSLSFPPTLSAYERRIVHELAEKVGVIHMSHGEGSERYIVLSKNQENQDINDENKNSAIEEENAQNLTPENIETYANNQISHNELQCPVCNKMIPENNYNLHLLHCKVVEKEKSKTPKLKLRPKFEKKINNINTDDDLDSLLTEIRKEDNKCFFTKCKTNISVLGQRCQFCRNNFCLSHHMPEIHGCGDLAKSHARSQIRKEGKIYSGSGVPSKEVDPAKRAHLQRKLDKKLSEMSQQRKIKKK